MMILYYYLCRDRALFISGYFQHISENKLRQLLRSNYLYKYSTGKQGDMNKYKCQEQPKETGLCSVVFFLFI